MRKKQEQINKNWIDNYEATIPLPDEKNYGDVAKLIKKEVEEKGVYNIGVVAPYGAGKSSAIETFLSHLNCFQKKKICRISVANFPSIVDEKNKDSKISFDEQNVEKSILQQIVYQKDSFFVKDSRFKKINGYGFFNVLKGIFISIFCCILVFIALQFFHNPFYIETPNVRNYACWIAAGVDFILLICIMVEMVKNNTIKRIKVAEIEFEKNASNEISPFNKYIDEVIYRFRNLKYNIVLIEDLDRFNNHYIFAKLKELCSLINSNNKIKWKVSFIYAVKDSMFDDEEERSKFFDCIIPIIPALANNSSYEIVGEEVNRRIGEGIIKKVLIDEIAPYIKNRRVLTNVINDWFFYSNSIGKCDYNSLFALMVLKNVEAKEFENMQCGKGNIVSQLKNKKYEIIDSITSELKQEKENLKIRIDKINENIKKNNVDGMNSLLLMLTGAVANYFVNVHNNNNYSFNKINTQIVSFQGLNDAISVSYYNYNYGNFMNYTVSLKEIEKNFFGKEGFFAEQEKIISGKIIEERNILIEKRKIIDLKINEFNNFSYVQLVEEFPDKFKELPEGLVRFLLVNGYITENYSRLLSNQGNSYISQADKELINKINNKIDVDFNLKADDVEQVIRMLRKERFSTRYICNYSILNFLLENRKKDSDKYSKLMEYLSVETNGGYIINRIIESVLPNDDKNDIMSKLVQCQPKLWNQIYGQSDNLSDEDLSAILENHISMFDEMNSNGNISKFLSNTCCFKLDALGTDLFFKLNGMQKIIINDLKIVSNKELLKLIVKNKCYYFSKNNINYILVYLYDSNQLDINTKNFQCVAETQNVELFEDVMSNFERYISFIYSDDVDYSYNLDEKIVDMLIQNTSISIDCKKRIVSYETNCPSFYKDIDKELLVFLLDNLKIRLSFKQDEFMLLRTYVEQDVLIHFLNRFDYLKKLGSKIYTFKDELKNYLLENLEITDDVIGFIKNNSIKIGACLNNLVKAKLLLDNDKILFQRNVLENINNSMLRNLYVKKFKNQYLIDVSQLDKIEVAHVILSKELNNDELAKLISALSITVFVSVLGMNSNIYPVVIPGINQIDKIKAFLLSCQNSDLKVELIDRNRDIIPKKDFVELVDSYIDEESINKATRSFKYYLSKTRKELSMN